MDKKIKEVIKKRGGILLDIGCGQAKASDEYVGMDVRPLPGVDIVHNLEKFPWPILDESCILVHASHILEHVDPGSTDPRLVGLVNLLLDKKLIKKSEVSNYLGEYEIFGTFMRLMDEVWRITKMGGKFHFVVPYAGSGGYYQDPTHCLKQGSEVLTRDGFKNIPEIKVGEEVLTKNIETGTEEWSRVERVVVEPYEGDLITFKHNMMNISVTPNHDMVWSTWMHRKMRSKGRADEFPQSGRYGEASISEWLGEDPEEITIADTGTQEGDVHSFVAEDYMKLLGWIVSEGGFVANKGTQKYVMIFQGSTVNEDNYNEIVALVDRMGFKFKAYERRIDIASDNLYADIAHIGKDLERFIPQKYKGLSKRLLLLLLETALLGDGEGMANSDGHVYTSISKALADDINELAVKCGFRSSIRLRKGKRFTAPNGKDYNRKDQYRVTIFANRPVSYPRPVIEPYAGNIECVTVEKNHTIFVRQNGHTLWTGNCNPISEATVAYFDPYHPSGLWNLYKPKPWKTEVNTWQNNGFLEVLLKKIEVPVEDKKDKKSNKK